MTVESDLRRILDELSDLRGSVYPHAHSEPERREERHSFGGRFRRPDSEVHIVKDHEKTCTEPGCLERNPYFADETFCDPEAGGCGRDLGSIANASSLESCPTCHKSTAKVKLNRYVHCENCHKPLASSREEFQKMNLIECPNCGGSEATWSEEAGD